MAVCKFEGNSDMYGLGIRLGYYLQWFGAIIAAWIARSEVSSLRFSINLFVAATFLALIILTADDVDALQPIETYIVLLLMFGAYLALVPIYLWRLLTRCDPYWDPTRYPLSNPGRLAANLSFWLLIGVLVFQYWFWFARVPMLDDYSCEQFGFLLAQVRLNSKASIVVNALLYFWLGLVCLYILFLKIRHTLGFPDLSETRKKRVISRRHKAAHIQLLRNMEGWFRIIVATLVVAAVELSIAWNEIEGVNSLAGAGQTIPFIIGVGGILRILYVYFSPKYDDDDSGSYSASVHSHRQPPGSGPIPTRQPPEMRMREPRRSSRRRNYGINAGPIRVDQMPVPMGMPPPPPIPAHQMPMPAARPPPPPPAVQHQRVLR